MAREEDILHQEDVEEVISEVIEEGVGQNQAAISDVAAPSAGYVQAEAAAARSAINFILEVLRNAGMIEES